jgi:HEAT repeat protein
MKLVFWRKEKRETRDRRPETGNREPLTDTWDSRLLGPDYKKKLSAIREAGDTKNIEALYPLIKLLEKGDLYIDEILEAIPQIIIHNPGNPKILAIMPWIEGRLDEKVPCDEVWLLSAITTANPGMFSGLVPTLLRMLENYSKAGELMAVKDVVICLGNIGHESAAGPLKALGESGQGDDELRELALQSLEKLGKSRFSVN